MKPNERKHVKKCPACHQYIEVDCRGRMTFKNHNRKVDGKYEHCQQSYGLVVGART